MSDQELRTDRSDAERVRTPDALFDRLERRVAEGDPQAQGIDERRTDRLGERLASAAEPEPSSGSILDRLAKYGITPGNEEIRPDSIVEHDHDDSGEPLTMGRINSLEIVRYVLILSLLASAVAAGWFVNRSVSAGDLVDGDITPLSIDGLDIARRAFVSALGMALALIPLWAAVAATWSRRAGAVVRNERLNYLLFLGTFAVQVVTFVIDGQDRGWISLLGVIVCLAASVWSISVASSIQRWFQQSTVALLAWSSTLSVAVVTSWIGGMYRPITPDDSLEAMTFFGGLQVVLMAIVVVVAAVGTSDVEDHIRLAPTYLRHSDHPVFHPDGSDQRAASTSPQP